MSSENFSSSEQTANDVQEDTQTLATSIEEIQTQVLPQDKLCTPCLEQNLIEKLEDDNFKVCPTCQELFCIHSASKLDPQYCVFCNNDFQLSDVSEIVTRSVHDENGRITSSKTFRIRHLGLSGEHWLFYNRAITSLNDIELDCAIEYHRGIQNGMLQEREARRTQKAHRNKGKIAGNESASLIEGTAANPLIQTQDGAVFAMSSTTTRSRRTRTVKTSTKKTDPMSQAMANIQMLLKQGYSQDQIMEMITGAGKG